MRAVIIGLLTWCSLYATDLSDFAVKMQYETSYEKAVQKAKVEKKKVMLLLVTHYCPWCTKFEKRTLSLASIDTAIHNKYVPLILNRQKGKFPKKFDSKRVPTVYFIDPNNESLVYKSVGYRNKKDFTQELKKAEK